MDKFYQLKKYDSFTISAKDYYKDKELFNNKDRFLIINTEYSAKPWYQFFKRRKLKSLTIMYLGENSNDQSKNQT